MSPCFSAFLDAFFPNLLATLIGAGAGVPAGLWVNRRVIEHQADKERTRRRVRLRQHLEWLLNAGSQNLVLIREAADAMKGGRWVSGLSLDLSAWDTLRQSVVADLDSLDNLDLGLRLARFYEELALYAAHAERFVTTQTAPDPSGEARLRAQAILGDDLRRFAERLIPALEALQAAVIEERRRIEAE